jgi:hypothetical protein
MVSYKARMFEEHHEDSEQLVENIRKYAHWRLQLRLIFYVIIAASILGIGMYHIVRGDIPVVYPTMGLIAGMILGVIVSRMFHITWDHQAQMVISRLDAMGIVILILYILLELNREQVVRYFINNDYTISISFALLAGIMVGRVIGIRRKVKQVLEQNL